MTDKEAGKFIRKADKLLLKPEDSPWWIKKYIEDHMKDFIRYSDLKDKDLEEDV